VHVAGQFLDQGAILAALLAALGERIFLLLEMLAAVLFDDEFAARAAEMDDNTSIKLISTTN